LKSNQRHGWLAAASAILKKLVCGKQACEEEFSALLDHLREGVLIIDASGCIVHANRVAQACFSHSGESILGAPLYHLNGDTGALEAAWRSALDGTEIVELLGKRCNDGLPAREISLFGGTHKGRRAVVALVHVPEDRSPAGSDAREVAAFFEVTKDAIMVTDADGRITSVNPAFSAMTGYSEQEAIGQTPRLLRSGKQDSDFYAHLWTSLKAGGGWEGEIWNRRKNGELFIQYENISAIRDERGNITKYVAVLNDITEKHRLEKEIEYRANYDSLTGLANRSLLIEHLDQAIKQGKRRQGSTAVLFIDLDHFKRVNDKLGHSYGDKLLREAAVRLQQCVRESDTVARQGGDEFVVVLPQVKGIDDAARVAEKVIAALSVPFHLDASIVSIGASVGIALSPDDGTDVDTLFRNADLAMYRAKSLGRNGFQFFEQEMTESAVERRRLFDEMQIALAQEEFELHYLPIFDLHSGLPVGAEALLRWNHPLRGLIEPSQFITLAEESGLIGEIDRWVLLTACRHLRRWCSMGLDLRMSIAVNLSDRKIPDVFTVDWLQAMLASHGLSAHQIQLEINEKLLLDDGKDSQRWVSELRERGFSIVLDDFGTGYSSLSRLKDQPIDIIKVDRSLVAQMVDNPRSASMVRAILSLAHAFGSAVIAEGVETDAQAVMLKEMGCSQVQGYHLSRPLPADKFGQWAIELQEEYPL
jgi:diguanylate cyclase (GGDEF)-like protein/PAS domain S-box-containing protein